MNAYDECLRHYLRGDEVGPNERATIDRLAISGESPVIREKARVLSLCLSGQFNHDAHTRNLATRRTINRLSTMIVRPSDQEILRPAARSA